MSNTASSLPQEIHKPIVERLRAFTWVDKPKKQNKFAHVEDMTPTELLQLLSAAKDKLTKQQARVQVELQKRYIKELVASIPEWGVWGGPTYLLDTETQNVERGQAMRFGVLQCRGFQYHELVEFMQENSTRLIVLNWIPYEKLSYSMISRN
jgi:hypothetical protein